MTSVRYGQLGESIRAGKSITIKNKAFRQQLHKHLELLQKDLQEGAFEVWADD